METQSLLAAFGQTGPAAEVAQPKLDHLSGAPTTLTTADKRRSILIIALLVLVNCMAFLLLAVITSRYPSLSAGATLAYTFGLRHAVDADHIAAIDNVTRKLLTEKPRQAPLLVGLFFSLGHSTVVMLMCLFIALGSSYLSTNMTSLKDTLAPIGTLVSVSVLLLVAALNVVTAKALWDEYHEKRVKGQHKHYR